MNHDTAIRKNVTSLHSTTQNLDALDSLYVEIKKSSEKQKKTKKIIPKMFLLNMKLTTLQT